jgi:hypothetical protein
MSEAMGDDAMEESLEDIGPVLSEEADGELVHWMGRKPLSLGPAGVSATAVGAFVLGVAATLLVLALSDIVDPLVAVRQRRRQGAA